MSQYGDMHCVQSAYCACTQKEKANALQGGKAAAKAKAKAKAARASEERGAKAPPKKAPPTKRRKAAAATGAPFEVSDAIHEKR